MALRCILIPTAAGLDTTRRLDASLLLSKRIGAHVQMLFASPEPQAQLATLPGVVRDAGITIETLRREQSEAKVSSKAALEAWCKRNAVEQNDRGHRIDAVFATWTEKTGELEANLAVAGRVNDIIIVDRPDRFGQIAERIFDTAVFSTGRPVLVLPEPAPDDLLRHVVVAWNGSLEAARTVGLSIDLLHEAERVTVMQLGDHVDDGSAKDLAAYLRWHGVVTGLSLLKPTRNHLLGETMLEAVSAAGTTMLVMGAYTHSRVRQFQMGGLTRHVLDHAAIPVLMTH